MLEDWEAQQETKKKEEAIWEREKEQKELTKDLAKIIRTRKKKRKKRYSTSSGPKYLKLNREYPKKQSREQEKEV